MSFNYIFKRVRTRFRTLGVVNPRMRSILSALVANIHFHPGKEGILRCHPDLAGRELQRGTLTRESTEEQAAAGMNALGPEDVARMARLNAEYKQRFGFPFVICARMNDKASILRKLSERCRNERAVEVTRGIGEVKKICQLRLRALVHDESAKL